MAMLNYQRVNGGFNYPLVNIQKTMERSTMLLVGKLTISMAIFNSYVSHYQRVWSVVRMETPSLSFWINSEGRKKSHNVAMGVTLPWFDMVRPMKMGLSENG